GSLAEWEEKPAAPFLPRLVRGFLKQNAASIIGELLVVLVAIIGIFGPYVAPYDPIQPDPALRLQPPNAEHIFGTDELGRDLFSRLLFGARNTLITVAFVLFLVAALGLPLGALAGYLGGWIDEVIMRIGDLVLAFPALVLAMALVVAMG